MDAIQLDDRPVLHLPGRQLNSAPAAAPAAQRPPANVTAPAKPARKATRPSPRPWRQWLTVTHADGRPWSPETHALRVEMSWRLPRWIKKITTELADLLGVTFADAAVITTNNQLRIEAAFLAGTARANVVNSLAEIATAPIKKEASEQQSTEALND